MSLSWSKLLIGRPVANREAEGHKLGMLTGVPAMGLDGLGSASYGPEAALTILAATGASGLGAIGPITWVILLLLAILFFSYWQTVAAYPNNGGSYIVAKDNLGTNAGLLAAAALMVDYLLNVAVGISAGVGALTSAMPVLHPYTLWLCLGVLLVITVTNLRGTRESGLAWAVPTYLFVASLTLILVWGTYKLMMSDGQPEVVVAPPHIPQARETITLWLLLRAFASGCTAMTGVEAVSTASVHLPSRRYATHTRRWRRSLSFSPCSCLASPMWRAATVSWRWTRHRRVIRASSRSWWAPSMGGDGFTM
jgi:amino acid transporter